jgi:hypothetical protein
MKDQHKTLYATRVSVELEGSGPAPDAIACMSSVSSIFEIRGTRDAGATDDAQHDPFLTCTSRRMLKVCLNTGHYLHILV